MNITIKFHIQTNERTYLWDVEHTFYFDELPLTIDDIKRFRNRILELYPNYHKLISIQTELFNDFDNYLDLQIFLLKLI